jgi:hypothetical protein
MGWGQMQWWRDLPVAVVIGLLFGLALARVRAVTLPTIPRESKETVPRHQINSGAVETAAHGEYPRPDSAKLKVSSRPVWEHPTANSLADLYHRVSGEYPGGESLEGQFREQLERFGWSHGQLVNYYFSETISAGAVLTREEDRHPLLMGIKVSIPLLSSHQYILHLVLPTKNASPAWITEMLLRLDLLHLKVRQFVGSATDRQLCMEIIFSLVTQLLRQMEDQNNATTEQGTRIDEREYEAGSSEHEPQVKDHHTRDLARSSPVPRGGVQNSTERSQRSL